MAIAILTGIPGSGKTYILTAKAKQFLDQGREVWCNKGYTIKDDRVHYYSKIEELTHLRDAIILMDEAQVYLNARKWEVLDESFIYLLQQHRHYGLDIWGTVQNIRRLDVVMRELVAFYYECSSIKFFKWEFFHCREYRPEEDKPTPFREKLSSSFYRAKQEIFDLYDTHGQVEEMQTDDQNLVIKKFLRCPECGHDRLVG